MKKSIFKGAATAIITPMKNGEVDFDALRRLVDFQIENGIDALVAAGTTGESSTLTDEELVCWGRIMSKFWTVMASDRERCG